MKSKEDIEFIINTRKQQIDKLKDLKLITRGVQYEFLNLSIQHQNEIIEILEWILNE